jgi:squalene-hopene/tetraprenyl-beta-curcumene cyclase
MATTAEPTRSTDSAPALQAAVDHLLGLQSADGWWRAELATNVTMDAEDLLLREFLGIRTAEQTRRTADWIRSQQRSDGTWATFFEGPGELSTTAEAYLGLRLAGDPPEAEHLAKAAEFITDAGGLEHTRVFTKFWCALFGLWPWDELPVMPPEVMFLPVGVPLNIYDFASWARQTIVPITVVAAHRPVRPLELDLEELRTHPPAREYASLGTAAGWLDRLDRVLAVYERRPPKLVRRRALALAEHWIVRRQEADGSWGGIQPPWVYSIMALSVQGYPLDHPVMRAGLEGLDGFTIDDGAGRRLEACQSPVWDTALATIALGDAGLAPGHEATSTAGDWLASKEVTYRGDWAVARPQAPAGGWAFEFANVNYPDLDDTAEVVVALRQTDRPDREPVEAAIRRGVAWAVGMQSSDGGWGAFDADNTRQLCRELPFLDFGEVIDPPSADVTAHVVEMLAGEGMAAHPVVSAGVAWLLGNQEPDGSWFGRWGANHLYGTGAAVPALVAAGIPARAPAVRRAVDWVKRCQNADGGWGEDLRSYRDQRWRGRGHSTPSQTAWALMALLAADEQGEAVEAGVGWLVEHQRADGSWDEPWFTGTGFPGDFYINYHLYRLVFPVTALGRYQHARTRGLTE